MKRIVFVLFFLAGLQGLKAQGDLPTTKPIEIGKKNNLDALSSKTGTALKIPSVLDEKLVKEKKGVYILPQKKLRQAGHGMKIDPKIAQGEGPKTSLLETSTSEISKPNPGLLCFICAITAALMETG